MTNQFSLSTQTSSSSFILTVAPAKVIRAYGELQKAAEIALDPNSDIHRLPFKVAPEQLMAAVVETTAPLDSRELGGLPIQIVNTKYLNIRVSAYPL